MTSQKANFKICVIFTKNERAEEVKDRRLFISIWYYLRELSQSGPFKDPVCKVFKEFQYLKYLNLPDNVYSYIYVLRVEKPNDFYC